MIRGVLPPPPQTGSTCSARVAERRGSAAAFPSSAGKASGKGSKEVYVCSDCGEDHGQWQGKCRACQAWNTLVAFRPSAGAGKAGGGGGGGAAVQVPHAHAALSLRHQHHVPPPQQSPSTSSPVRPYGRIVESYPIYLIKSGSQ